MQQYRVNYPLLIGLVVGTFVCSGAVYGLWKFQIERKSGWLISEAEKAAKDGDKRRAVEFYGQYLTIQQDPEVQLKYAKTFAELTEEDDVTPQEFHMAWQALEGIIRDPTLSKRPESNDLRQQLVRLYAMMHRFPDAIDQLDILLQQGSKDAELHVLRAKYVAAKGNHDEAVRDYYKLIGYDPETKTFNVEKAIAPHNIEVYVDAARLVRTRKEDLELATEIVDQMVTANPESAEAYLARGQYRNTTDDKDAAAADIEKAYQLAPEDVDVLVAIAVQTGQDVATDETDATYKKVTAYLDKGKKLFPEDFRFYQVAADVEIKRKKYDEALAQIDAGLKKIGTKKASMLLLFKADLQLNEEDLKGANQTIEDMKREEFRSEFIDWYLARVMLAESRWFQAKEALGRLRPRVADDPNPWPLNLRDIDFYLGLCYERLGQLAEARDQYELVTDADAENESAIAGKKRVELALDPRSTEVDPIQTSISKELEKPVDQQDWSSIQGLVDKLAKERNLDETTKLVYTAQLLSMRQDYEGARKALAAADKISPKSLTIHHLAVQLARLDPKVGPEKAMSVLNTVVKNFGDQPSLRLDKADILIALKKDDPAGLRAELASLGQGMDKWTTLQKVELWTGMASKYLNMGMAQEAREYWTLAADNQPYELPLRLQLFQLALLDNDDAGMKAAQDKILEIVKDPDDATWLYTEARRKLSQLRRGELGREAIEEIRLLINRAVEQRHDWHELYVVDAELEMVTGNLPRALQSFDEAAKRGLPNQLAMASYIDLLTRAGRYGDAAKQLERLPETSRQALLGPLYTDILFRTNQVDSALEKARLATESDANNVQSFFWYSQLLARSAFMPNMADAQRKAAIDKAIASMKRVVELQPELADGWFFLINLYANQKADALAQQTLRDAQLALSGDNLQMFLAKSYEALGRWFDAETMYRSYYEGGKGEKDELQRAQRLAEFYLGQGYQQADRVVKVTPLLNQILRGGATGKLENNDASLQWARRMAARILAGSDEYPKLVDAEKLLTANSQGGDLLLQDKLEMAHILAPRPEPASRKRAIAYFEDIAKVQPLDERGQIALGNLYQVTGRWRDYVSQMDQTVAQFPQSARAREAYARKLIVRVDNASLNKAIDQVQKLGAIAPNSVAAFELGVKLANKLGDEKNKQAIRDKLVARQPKLEGLTQLTPQMESAALLFGSLFVELKDFESAEKIYRQVAAIDPQKALGLALFLGMNRSVDQCFEQLNSVYQADKIPDILGVALAVVREKRDEVGDKYDAQITSWMERGLLDNPDSITLLMLQADLNDIQKKYDEAAATYRKLLGRNDLTGMRRAVVLNNLSYLVSLAGPKSAAGADPLKLANEAAEILGPNSDILDTRAVAYMAAGNYSRAIDDLTDSVTDNPTPAKYFHLAEAYLRAGEKKLAKDNWIKAEELGLTRESLNRMEHNKFDELKRTIDQIPGGAAVTQSEPSRRAG